MDPDAKSSFEKAFPIWSQEEAFYNEAWREQQLFCQEVESGRDCSADVRVEAVRADLHRRASLTKREKLNHSKLDENMNKACGELASATLDGIKDVFWASESTRSEDKKVTSYDAGTLLAQGDSSVRALFESECARPEKQFRCITPRQRGAMQCHRKARFHNPSFPHNSLCIMLGRAIFFVFLVFRWFSPWTPFEQVKRRTRTITGVVQKKRQSRLHLLILRIENRKREEE